jgi:hypothetical protein
MRDGKVGEGDKGSNTLYREPLKRKGVEGKVKRKKDDKKRRG